MKKEFKLNFLGRDLIVETGQLAKQTNGSVLVRYGDTVVLSVCVMGKTPVTQDFFPLQVLYQEKLYSVGKIPGGFIKREGRPTDSATLAARLIDRPIRPMFDENLRNEIQVINTVLSVDQDNSPEMAAMFGSSLCLGISDIPFDGPVAGVMVGMDEKGKFIINPTTDEAEKSKLALTVAGTHDAICMVEAGCKELPEKTMLEALMFAHENIKKLCEFEQSIIDEIGVEKVELPKAEIDSEIEKSVRDFATADMLAAIQIKEKLEKYAKIDEVKENTMAHFDEVYAEDPREFLAKIPKKYQWVGKQSLDYVITNEDLAEYNFTGDFGKDRKILKYFRVPCWSEGRFFRYRKGLTWTNDKKNHYPEHIGVQAPDLILVHHYLNRSPEQIKKRIEVRMNTKMFKEGSSWGTYQADWKSAILNRDGLEYFDDNLDRIKKLPVNKGNFKQSFLKNTVKRILISLRLYK